MANKCDTAALEPQTAEFYKLGRGKLVCVSALQNRNREELLDVIRERLPPPEAVEEAPRDPALKLAIVGRRNTGKSTFINSLAETDRMIVSETPGTTRDSVDVRFERDGLMFTAIDTAGVRKDRSLANAIEFYSMARAERSIRRADVVLMFLDPQVRISKVDKQLADYVLEQYKPAVFVVNKWDLMLPMRTGRIAEYVRKTFPTLDFVPIAFITAKAENKNVHATLNLAQTLHKQASRRVSTGELNRVLRQALEATAPPLRQNRRPKVYYASQVSTNPPTIVLFTNGPELFDNTYQRYLLKTFRDRLGFSDVPIKMYLRRKNREEQPTPEERALARKGKPAEEAGGKGKGRSRKPKVDVSKLPFQTDVTDEETSRGGSPYESELWKDP